MKQENAVVIGAAGAIGSAIVKWLGQNNYHVFSGDVSAEKKSPEYVDATDIDSLGAFSRNIKEASVLVYCAGVLEVASAEEAKKELFHRLFDSNVLGASLAVRTFLPQLARAENGGRIIFISSVSAHHGFDLISYYCASKAALEALARCLAVELAPKNIRINCVAPTMTESKMMWKELNQREARGLGEAKEQLEQCIASQPIPRVAQPEEIARICLMLADANLPLLTGQCIAYDGGLAAR